MSKDEVEKLREEAKKLSELDLKKREAIFKKNKVINQIYSLNQLSRGSSLPSEIKGEIASLVREAEKEIEKENLPTMEDLEKRMFALWQKASALSGGEQLPGKIDAAMDIDLQAPSSSDQARTRRKIPSR